MPDVYRYTLDKLGSCVDKAIKKITYDCIISIYKKKKK